MKEQEMVGSCSKHPTQNFVNCAYCNLEKTMTRCNVIHANIGSGISVEAANALSEMIEKAYNLKSKQP